MRGVGHIHKVNIYNTTTYMTILVQHIQNNLNM